MKAIAFSCCLLATAGARAGDRSWSFTADRSARPRDGQSVARMAWLPEAVTDWSADTTQRHVIHDPSGEDGQLWAFERCSWLAAGSWQAERIEIELSR